MKVRMFNKGQGWYVSASNYKDKQDKAFMNLHFSQNHCGTPVYEDNGRGFSVMEIDVEEAIFTSYKSKIGLTIFKYKILSDLPNNETDTSMFSGDRADSYKSLDIEPDDLPFY